MNLTTWVPKQTKFDKKKKKKKKKKKAHTCKSHKDQ